MTDVWPPTDLTDLEALTLTLWGEARDQNIEGLIGVAMVIRNRVLQPSWWGTGWVGVCLAQTKPGVFQFSCWSEEKWDLLRAFATMRPPTATWREDGLRRCQDVARATIAGYLADNTGGATHYLTRELYDRATPVWAKGRPIRQLGHHVFLRAA